MSAGGGTPNVGESMARSWLAARNVIAGFLKELHPDVTDEFHNHNAAAIIARLAHAEPPLLICTENEMKE